MEKLIKQSHEMAKNNGFWDEERNIPEMLMLVVSEVAEALEALRKDHKSDPFIVELSHKDIEDLNHENSPLWKEQFENSIKSSFEDELADVAIRLFDLCGGLNIDLQKHIELKMKYNSMRPYKHGKKF